MDLCFCSAYECQMSFFSDSRVLVRSFFKADFYVCMMRAHTAASLTAGPHTELFPLSGAYLNKTCYSVAYLQDLIQLLLPLLSGYQYIWSHSPPFISSLSLVHLASVSCWKYKGTLRSRCFLFLILTVWRVTTARGVIFCWPPMGEWLLGQLVFTPLGGKTTT